MLRARVNNVVNMRVVIRIARTATMLRALLLWNVRWLITLTGLNFLVLFVIDLTSLLCCDASVLDADDMVCHLRDLRVVGDHHDGLVELLAGHL